MITEFSIDTHGPACHEFTRDVADWLTRAKVGDGLLTLMVRHTSCSLLIQENADPDVQVDLLAWLDRIAPPADHPSMGWIIHRYEGPDDMPASSIKGPRYCDMCSAFCYMPRCGRAGFRRL